MIDKIDIKNSKNAKILLGAHVSIAGGLDQAIIRGLELDCTTIQIFTQNNRSWNNKKLSDLEINNFIKAQKNSNISVVVSHASYLINIGSTNNTIVDKSINTLTEELNRCESLKIPYLVLHPGSSSSSNEKDSIKAISNNINKIFKQNNSKTMILLETASGQGSSVGYTFEQLASIKEKIEDTNRIGICVDTCHIFTAGYDIRDFESYNKMWDKFHQILDINSLKVIHLNDSKKGLYSKIDRHEHIGKGLIGLNAFGFIMNDKRFIDIPKILETPKDNIFSDIENLNLLKSLIKNTP